MARRSGAITFPSVTRLALTVLVCSLAAPALARATRLASCNSGKAGHVELFVEPTDGGFALTSRDSAEGTAERVLRGTAVSATHEKLDARHHAYVFKLEGGELAQASGLDVKRCHDVDGGRARCEIDAVKIRLARHGPTEPGDDGMVALQQGNPVVMDNGGPQDCVVYASKALTALLKAGKRR